MVTVAVARPVDPLTRHTWSGPLQLAATPEVHNVVSVLTNGLLPIS